jgi:hypothetical protein
MKQDFELPGPYIRHDLLSNGNVQNITIDCGFSIIYLSHLIASASRHGRLGCVTCEYRDAIQMFGYNASKIQCLKHTIQCFKRPFNAM